MERVLARAALLVLLCDLAVVGVRASDDARTHGRDVTAPGPARTEIVLPAGQSIVSGTATSLAVDADVAPAVPTPFTVEAARATVHDAIVGDEPAAVVWNGGRPFTVEGTGGGLDPSPAHVELAPDGVVLALDGSPRPLLAGAYRTAAPVAVGRGGLATPRDGVAFTADARTTLAAAGHIRIERRPLQLVGPGRLAATGTFTIRTRDGVRPATSIVFGPGPFELAVTPVDGGWSVTATLQGPLVP